MIPKKYHAIAFVSILVMLLLLGLHLLGFGLLGAGSGSASARSAAASAALARNATTTSSSSLLTPSGASSNSVYRHPIVYDKLTGATNNQINDVLGNSKQATTAPDQYPIDHYQQQQQQQQQSQQLRNPFEPFPSSDVVVDPFASMPGRQPFPPPLPLPPAPPHTLNGGPGSLVRPPPPMMPPPPPHHRQLVPSSHSNLAHHNPRNQHQQHHHLMTTQAPDNRNQQQQQDSLPSASSVNNDGAAPRPQANASNSAAHYYPNSNQQLPVYYTPPIFTYSNNNNNNNNNYDLMQQAPPPQLGVPEVPLSVDEYNARQARLRGSNNQMTNSDQQQQLNSADKQQLNLLAEPQAQQRHKQQMLDRQLLFGGPAPTSQGQQHPNYDHPSGYFGGPQTLIDNSNSNNNNNSGNNFSSAAYYPDPAIYGRLTATTQQQQQQPPPIQSGQQLAFRPPYAHQMSSAQQQQLFANQLEAPSQLVSQHQQALKQMAPQNRIMAPPAQSQAQVHRQSNAERPAIIQSSSSGPLRQAAPTMQSASGSPPATASSIARAGQTPQTRLPPTQEAQPSCARQQQQQSATVPELDAATNGTARQLVPVLFCNEDADYPTSDIMRALENYAAERSVELILPQPLVQMLIQTGAPSSGGSGSTNNQKLAELQRQLSLDSLQPNINAQLATTTAAAATTTPTTTLTPGSDELGLMGAGGSGALFASSNYEPMCKAAIWMAQPRRAKNLLGQWKVIVNLPGHKYRGIAISQMVRIEECTRPNSECSSMPSQSSNGIVATTTPSSTAARQTLARSRCLQLYDNQRLLAWSHQQGLHFDIFRTPSACSCHNRRF